MTVKAKKRIQEAMEKKATSLDLSRCGLKEIPKEIGEMTWLTELDFYRNQLQKIEGLEMLTALQALFLHNNQLKKIEGLEMLTALQTLTLSRNQLQKIEGLEMLTALQALYLGGNQLQKIESLERLTALQNLYLHDNQLQKIEGLERLTALHTLSLSNNQLQKIEGLEMLTALQTLGLSGNQLQKIEGLEKLTALQALFLGDNQLLKIENLEMLTALQTLGLSGNQLQKIEGLGTLTALQRLYFSGNQLQKIEGLKALINLRYLLLQENQIQEIEGLETLQQLTVLRVSENPIRCISKESKVNRLSVLDISKTNIADLSLLSETLIKRLNVIWGNCVIIIDDIKDLDIVDLNMASSDIYYENGIYVKDCHHLKQPAPEWILLGPEMVREYFKAIKEQGQEEINEVKVLLIGDGGAGKTSLAYRLAKPKKELPKEEQRTRGVDIYDWKFQKDGKQYIVHLWDFGGQVMYDMVHQYFYSQRSLYILMDSSRSGANEHDSRLNQLLQSAELFGRNSPMLMIQNEHTGHQKKMDFNVLNKNYPFLKEYKAVNLKTKEGLSEIKSMLKRYIVKIPTVGIVMPKKWMRVREEIQKLQKNKSVMPLSDFRKICKTHGIKDVKGQNILSRYFHQLGVYLHFQDKKESALSKLIILNREWATKASYKVFDADIIKSGKTKGTFVLDDLEHFWPEEEFSDYRPELLDLLKEFEICFALKNTQKYLVPRMMDKMPEEEYCKKEERPLCFYYEYTFMPEGLVNRLSVRMHDMIGGKRGDMVWNDGVVFQDKKNDLTAELREIRQPDKCRIEIKIKGKDAYWMSETLIRKIDKINEDFNLQRLKVTINIPCICSVCNKSNEPYFLDFKEVKEDLQKEDIKFHSFLCKKSREKIDFHELLKTISRKALKEAIEKQKQNKMGRLGGNEILFRGDKSIGLAEKLMGQNNDEIIEEVKKNRKTIKKENNKTRALIDEKLADIPDIFRKELNETSERILLNIYGEMSNLELNIKEVNDLIKTVDKGVNEVFRKQPSEESLLRAFQEMAKINKTDNKLELKEKLKVSLWIIPTIL
ncbi:MAG TPA: hypothetical protein ENJ95_11015, partial [Bacteroidetes bacterium]|nr:hypothetical protein [Bacteroidota bacterium]